MAFMSIVLIPASKIIYLDWQGIKFNKNIYSSYSFFYKHKLESIIWDHFLSKEFLIKMKLGYAHAEIGSLGETPYLYFNLNFHFCK